MISALLLDLDRYLPPPDDADQAPAQASGEQQAQAPADEDPFAGLRTLDLEAEATVGTLKINNLRMSDLKAVITSKKGVLRVDPAQASLYQGRFTGLVELDARQKTPKARLKPDLKGVQIGPLLQDLAGEDRLVGTGEVEADLRVVGLSEAQVRNSLNGIARFAFRDGAYKGINVANLIRDAKAKLGMSSQGAVAGPQQTDFSEMSGSAKITNGVIDNQDLVAKSPLLRIDGKGQVDLPKDKLDYTVTTEVVGSLEGQGGKGRDELSGVSIPIRLTGSLDNPKPTVDLQAALSEVAKQKIDEKKAEIQKDLQDKATDEVGKALKGLFGK